MTNSFVNSMAEFRAQLQKGIIIDAYQGLLVYIRDLRSHFENHCAGYEIPNNIYYGYLDMTYFSILPPVLKSRQLKVAVVFVYESFRFEVWLSGRNRKVQETAARSIRQAGWQAYHLTPEPGKADSVLNHVLVEDPDFSDLDKLTDRIKQGTLQFIEDLEGFFSKLSE
jgi:hypothetical protein